MFPSRRVTTKPNVNCASLARLSDMCTTYVYSYRYTRFLLQLIM
jgi:hypothetical protein